MLNSVGRSPLPCFAGADRCLCGRVVPVATLMNVPGLHLSRPVRDGHSVFSASDWIDLLGNGQGCVRHPFSPTRFSENRVSQRCVPEVRRMSDGR